MLNVQSIFTNKIVASSTQCQVQEKLIGVDDVILKHRIGKKYIGFDMISALIVGVINIGPRNLQLTDTAHLIHVIDLDSPARDKRKTMGMDGMKIIWLLSETINGQKKPRSFYEDEMKKFCSC